MIFDLDNMINKNCEQILKQYLGVDSFENYDVKIQLLSQNDNQRFFDTYFKLTYKLTHLKNHLLVITAKSQSFCIHNFPVSNLNKFKKLFTYNDIDFAIINRLKVNKPSIESKKYVVSISSKIDTNNTFYILLELEKTELEIQAKRFIKNYLVMYKLKYNMIGWYKKLKYHLLSCYKDEETLPNRDDIAYTKIEAFRPFELTYRIFYEMAIRNCRVKKIIHALDYLYDIKKVQKNTIITIDEISCEIINEEKVYKIFGAVMGNDISNKTKFFMGVNSSKCQCVEEINENYYEMKFFLDRSNDSVDLDITVGTEYYKYDNKDLEKLLVHCSVSIRSSTTGVAKTNKKTMITISKDHDKEYTTEPNQNGTWSLELDDSTKLLDKKVFLKKYIDFLTPEEHQIYLTAGIPVINDLINEFETELNDQYLIHYKDSNINHSEKNHISLKKALYGSANKYFAREDEYDGYSVYQGIFKDGDGEFDISIIKQNITKLVVDKNLSTVQFNLNLPKAELIAYLSKIKENYDNDNSILKNTLELLGEDLNIEYLKIKDMDSLEWADTFYIYDHFKRNIEDTITGRRHEIKLNLTLYHEHLESITSKESVKVVLKNAEDIQNRFSSKKNSSNKVDRIEVDTIRDRYKIMETLIENKKYKFLIEKK